MYTLLILEIQTILVFHALKYFPPLKHYVINKTHCRVHNTQTFLLHTPMVSICSQDKINEFISGNIVLDNSNYKFIFHALNVSNNFATIDYDAHISTKIDYTINHVFRSMTVQEVNTLHIICGLERNQLLTILAMSVQNPQLAGFLLTFKIAVTFCTSKVHLPGFMIVRIFFLLYTKLIDALIVYLYNLKIFSCTYTPLHDKLMTMLSITCDNNPRNFIELDPDSDDQHFYILGPEPIKCKPPLMFTPSQIKTTIRPNTFTAQDAGIYSNADFDQFWNSFLFSKLSNSTLQLLGKALSYSFISSNTPDYDANSPHDKPYNTLRFSLHDKLINLTPLFTPTVFSDAFIALFGYLVTFSHNVEYIFLHFFSYKQPLPFLSNFIKQFLSNIIFNKLLL